MKGQVLKGKFDNRIVLSNHPFNTRHFNCDVVCEIRILSWLQIFHLFIPCNFSAHSANKKNIGVLRLVYIERGFLEGLPSVGILCFLIIALHTRQGNIFPIVAKTVPVFMPARSPCYM